MNKQEKKSVCAERCSGSNEGALFAFLFLLWACGADFNKLVDMLSRLLAFIAASFLVEFAFACPGLIKSKLGRPQSKALYQLFLNHPEGLLPADIMRKQPLFDEFVSYWKTESNGGDCVETFKKNHGPEHWNDDPKGEMRKIHRLVSDMNKSVESLAVAGSEFLKASQTGYKSKGQVYSVYNEVVPAVGFASDLLKWSSRPEW